jgi:hypothetical protein
MLVVIGIKVAQQNPSTLQPFLHVFVSLELFLNLQENLQDGSDP